MLILDVRSITKRFGGITALDSCSFSVDQGTIIGLIGPNGSGKTTLINVINGLIKPDSGDVIYNSKNLKKLSPHKRTKLGLGRTFQITRLFSNLTVLQNLQIGRRTTKKGKFRNTALELLDFFGLTALQDEYVRNLSYGQQKLLEFAMVLASEPSLVMLDEPVSGINPGMISKIGKLLNDLQKRGLTMVIIEHNMPFVMKICRRIVVLNQGKVIADGPPKEIQQNVEVMNAYLGGDIK